MAGRYGSTGVALADTHKGVFTNRSRTRLEHIKDGASKTIMFGETIGNNPVLRFNPEDSSRYTWSWVGIGALPIFLVGRSAEPTTDAVLLTDAPIRSVQTFNSEHRRVMNVCYADGSVKHILTEIDYGIFIALAGMTDGALGVKLPPSPLPSGGFGSDY
jgi:prepilin-type processing-associated H-X9-DG protein